MEHNTTLFADSKLLITLKHRMDCGTFFHPFYNQIMCSAFTLISPIRDRYILALCENHGCIEWITGVCVSA